MSLLLDALKKAAKDKNDSAAVEDETGDDNPEHELSLASSEDAMDDTEFTLEEDNDTQAVDAIADEDITLEIVVEEEKEPPVTASIDLIERRESPEKREEISEKALSMLIDKGNSESERLKKRWKTGAAIAAVLIVVSAGVYYYMQYQDTVSGMGVASLGQRPPQPFIDRPGEQAVEAAQKGEKVAVTPPVEKQASEKQARPVVPLPVKKRSVKVVSNAVKKSSPKRIQVITTKKRDPLGVLLLRAYDDYQAGSYESSRKIYAQVLQREVNNRDGLLGAAAVAIKQERYAFARQKYLRLLRNNPRDTIAQAGLASLELVPASDESRLKFMLQQTPDADHLYFSLGSLYAQQERWPDAQQAFFNALSADANNADYAYNLAVSLDHMGKYEQASRYYNQSLSLAIGKNINFSEQDALQRVLQITDTSGE